MFDIKEVEKLYKDYTKEIKLNGMGEPKTRLELAKETYGNAAFDEDEMLAPIQADYKKRHKA